jgi:hypothetical protein
VVKPVFLPRRDAESAPCILSLNFDSKPLSYLLPILPVSELKNAYVFNFSLVNPR